MKRLGELAEIRTGYPFRKRIERVGNGGCRLVQMGDVQSETGEVGDDLSRVEEPPKWKDHVVQNGDVLFIGRGARNEAATFVGKAADAIAAPHLFVLRVRNPFAVFPQYLTWFLNLPETQERIRAIRVGSGIPFVPMEGFARLEVPMPRMEVQNRIAGIQRLSVQEQALLEKIKERRRILVEGLMREAVRRGIDP